MPQQYHAADNDTGLEVTITGEFPPDPDDRVRIARTSNLFTRLMSTILSTENDYDRRERFRAIETQLEMADALIRGDVSEVQGLMRSTLSSMGVTEEQLSDAQEQFRSQLEAMGGDISAIEMMFGGSTGESGDAGFGPTNEVPGPLDDISLDDLTIDDLPQPERGNPDSDTGEEERSGDEGDIEADEQG
jgi:hypothetical protein